MLEVGEGRGEESPTRVDDDIPTGSEGGKAQAEGLADAAAHTVAVVRLADGAGRGEAEAGGTGFSRLQTEGGKQGAIHPGPFLVDLPEFRRAQESAALGECKRSRRITSVWRSGRSAHR